MKKAWMAFLLLAAVFSMFSVAAFAAAQAEAGTADYYDENGNLITVDGVYYSVRGFPCFNAECFYLDDDGNPVCVGGCRAYCYDKDGNLVPGRYCYDAEGNAIPPPDSYRGGCCGGEGRGGRRR